MGKHGKKVPCGMCSGTGTIDTTNDGKTVQIPCTGCDGSGEQG